MKRSQFQSILFSLLLLGVAAPPPLQSSPRPKGNRTQFVIDANKPFVYIRFDHVGPGVPRNDDEPPTRIWLQLRNNCRVPIVIFANGVPDESPKYEVGLRYEIVANPRTLGLQVVLGNASEAKTETDVDDDSGAADMPRNDLVDVMSSISIDPGEAILFSMPVNHVGKHWHVEIPFEFEVPRGKCCRDENNGGLPVMRVHYGLYDLPPQAQKEIPTK